VWITRVQRSRSDIEVRNTTSHVKLRRESIECRSGFAELLRKLTEYVRTSRNDSERQTKTDILGSAGGNILINTA
jgi:hypothetical protein